MGFGWWALHRGIHLGHLSLFGYESEKLYLKLNKRLTLKIARLRLPQKHTAASQDGLKKGLDILHRFLKYFYVVEIGALEIGGTPYQILYRDNILYLKGGDYEVAGMVYDRGDSMEIQLPLVRIPSHRLTLSGEVHYHYRDGRLSASGYYAVADMDGSFRVEREGKRLQFHLDSDPTKTLQHLQGLVPLSPVAREWLLERLHASRYRLVSFDGEGELDLAHGTVKPVLSSLHGVAELRDVALRFHDQLKPITAPKARVILQKGALYFTLQAPRYGKHRVDGSSAALLSLFEPSKLKLLLRLRYTGRVDWQILKILNTYGIRVLLGQKQGKAVAKVDIDAPLVKGPVKIRGIARLSPGVLEYRKKTLRVGGGVVAFTSRVLELRDFAVNERVFRGVLNGRIDLKSREGDLRVLVKRLSPRFPVKIFEMRNVRLPVKIHWGEKGVKLAFPTFKSGLRIDPRERLQFEAKDLALWHPYLRGLLRLVDGGKIRIETAGANSWKVSGTLMWKGSPFYTKRGVLTRWPFVAVITPQGVEIDALDGKLHYSSKEQLLQLQGINVDAEKLLAAMKQIKGSAAAKGRLVVLGKKSLIRYGPYVLLTDNYRLVKRGENIDFAGALGSDRLSFQKHGGDLKIMAEGIGDRMLHALIHFNGIQEGRYTIHVTGNDKKGYTGEILIHGGVLRGFKAYNDLIALINAVPALVSFSSPGFSHKGFELKQGTILFTLKGKRLKLGRILLVGKSATVAGKGVVELDSKRLDVDLAIRTAREMGKALSTIPVVGYILFGKDKSLTAGVKITGTLDHPKVHTNPVGEALLYPLELLKRTLTAPAHLSEPEEDTELLTTPPPEQAAPLPPRFRGSSTPENNTSKKQSDNY
ncbi:AsmA-like C-terminal domain-containing protein [Nitratifractor salsuginis]|uniref:YhdP family protein n=1 Tax=Nitratifractor salsuginis TaxID=269261 RepID=UPI00145C830D|nr:AsmA-like C-terminal domain-containing protein [Nitratifractor salsuginis]